MRFGSKNILKVQCFKPVEDLNQLITERKNKQKKLKKTRKANQKNPDRKMKEIGSICNKKKVDYEEHLLKELKDIDAKILEI